MSPCSGSGDNKQWAVGVGNDRALIRGQMFQVIAICSLLYGVRANLFLRLGHKREYPPPSECGLSLSNKGPLEKVPEACTI